jgi:mycothiol system anti-sigma-R factor
VNRECRETSSVLYLVIDGEASRVVQWRVTRHIEMCPECSRRYEFERKLKELIERACQCVGCPDGFEERLRSILLSELE